MLALVRSACPHVLGESNTPPLLRRCRHLRSESRPSDRLLRVYAPRENRRESPKRADADVIYASLDRCMHGYSASPPLTPAHLGSLQACGRGTARVVCAVRGQRTRRRGGADRPRRARIRPRLCAPQRHTRRRRRRRHHRRLPPRAIPRRQTARAVGTAEQCHGRRREQGLHVPASAVRTVGRHGAASILGAGRVRARR